MHTQSSFAKQVTGSLYLVPTPIGNLEDMTFRALNILKEVDLIAAEDTRHTQQLLNHFEIQTKQISFHEHNTQMRIPELIDKMIAGENIAQVSDAGMPSISDPGAELVEAAIAAGLAVIPLPGANAGLTALIASGLVPQPFYFYGFLGRKATEQKVTLAGLANREETMIFYESPYRLKKTLATMIAVIGAERQVVLARELTKRYEEFIRGSLAEVSQWAQENEIRGEFVMILAGNENPELDTKINETDDLSIVDYVNQLINQGNKPNDAIKVVAKNRGLKKQQVYNIYHELDDGEE
ncbi:16S rRNA (cytidine(1402)-2'-O)-methyltransferase [Periweissella fabalis]|uniref:Ribosomal RNA small subunit methyltransferase I n=1 Tax=Periweissella fabalis TaxID=1070421 RepID=A0A7X6N247_9LACO|nr:16S rRNA (cytidine(1402)-2'-O)-methyltransferase [Periweissella fabalis]MCM0598708.1 16S rRNA (cytidine(1402)-2'-O)-methyltransferase [Periweissella fabalis]NKZ24361.1 16S rRNA (cytidine(1402)-2'-O)-methyltransferase [Periweissella fabalis]